LFPQALGGENAAPAREDVMEKELNRSERKLWQKIVAADGGYLQRPQGNTSVVHAHATT
jgi:hypothetical protein